jgi:Domain of unknown function (DUF4276)
VTVAREQVTIAPVVEGHGDVEAVRVLLRRIGDELGVYDLAISQPLRLSRTTLGTEAGIVSAVQQAAYRVGSRGGVLVLFDADDDCPKDLVGQLLVPAREARKDKTVSLVVANREFENWFLAAADSVAGQCGLPVDFSWAGDPEAKRGAKEILSVAMKRASGHRYSETVDQARLAATFDMQAARQTAPSFDKFYREIEVLCDRAPD